VALNQQPIIHFSMKLEMLIITEGQVVLYISGSYQQLKRVEFVSFRIMYVILRGCCCHITILKVLTAK
jgi:hypothetical protein